MTLSALRKEQVVQYFLYPVARSLHPKRSITWILMVVIVFCCTLFGKLKTGKSSEFRELTLTVLEIQDLNARNTLLITQTSGLESRTSQLERLLELSHKNATPTMMKNEQTKAFDQSAQPGSQKLGDSGEASSPRKENNDNANPLIDVITMTVLVMGGWWIYMEVKKQRIGMPHPPFLFCPSSFF